MNIKAIIGFVAAHCKAVITIVVFAAGVLGAISHGLSNAKSPVMDQDDCAMVQATEATGELDSPALGPCRAETDER